MTNATKQKYIYMVDILLNIFGAIYDTESDRGTKNSANNEYIMDLCLRH